MTPRLVVDPLAGDPTDAVHAHLLDVIGAAPRDRAPANAAQRMILARAEKRLTSHIEHHGIDAAALRLAARYEAEYTAAAPAPTRASGGFLDSIFRDVVAAGIGEVA